MSRTSIRIACLICVVIASEASADVGPPNFGGRIAGDPAGLRDVAVERSTLVLDLRPLAAGGLVRIDATYRLNNPGADRRLDLLLTAGPNIDEFRLTLDDQLLAPARRLQKGELVEGWVPPRETPKIAGRGRHGSLAYRPRSPAVLVFNVTIPPGRCRLHVSYECEAATHLYGDPTIYRQFAYVFSPARGSPNYGGIDLTVHVPPGWYAATNLELPRDGDQLTGHFDALPADSLAITIQSPESPSYASLTYGTQILLLISVISGIVGAWWLGRRLGRRATNLDGVERGFWARHVWPWSIVYGLTWAIVVAGSGALAVYLPDKALPQGQASHYGYGQASVTIGVFLLAAILAPIGFVVTQVMAVVATNPVRPNRSPHPVDSAG